MKTQFTVLASATRSTATNSSGIDCSSRTHIAFLVAVTAASGTGGLTGTVGYWDEISEVWRVLSTNGAWSIGTTTGYRHLAVGLGTATTSFYLSTVVTAPLPRTIRLQIAVGDATDYTYSIIAWFP